MEAKDAFAWIKSDLNQLLSHGFEFVHTRSLLAAVERQETNAPQVSQWADLENKTRIANADRKSTMDLEMFKSVLETGKTALTTAILVNGGASVALLAFLANVSVKTEMVARVPALAGALMWFVFGVLSAACATGMTYLTQSAYAKTLYSVGDQRSIGLVSRLLGRIGKPITVALVVATYLMFAIGSYAAYLSFRA